MDQPVYPAKGHIDPGIKIPFPSARRPAAHTPEFRERLASVRHRMQFETCRFLVVNSRRLRMDAPERQSRSPR